MLVPVPSVGPTVPTVIPATPTVIPAQSLPRTRSGAGIQRAAHRSALSTAHWASL